MRVPLLFLGSLATVTAWTVRQAAHAGPAAIKMFLLEQSQQKTAKQASFSGLSTQQPLIQPFESEFPARFFTQPLDHFAETGHTFPQRYWVNTRHYVKGGPVIVLDGGETSGEDRLPFLDTGIVNILANATNGLGIVLEHRYYGTSMPVANLSTDSLRWLNNAQSAADSANFMANVQIEGIDEDLTATKKPWIYYGGSYAGARAAHMRVVYPSLVFGAIASSAVTHAQIPFPEYYDLIRNYTEPDCREALEKSVKTVDHLLSMDLTRGLIKSLFGLHGLKDDHDFVSVLHSVQGSWQSKNWDPAVGSTRWDDFCAALVGKSSDEFLTAEDFAALESDGHELSELFKTQAVDFTLLNYALYVRKYIVSRCPEGRTVEECFGSDDPETYLDTSLDSTWRAWTYQVCTGKSLSTPSLPPQRLPHVRMGLLPGTASPALTTSLPLIPRLRQIAPPNPDHPSIISRLIDLEYTSRICKLAFPPGKVSSVPNWPNVTAVNALGDFDITAHRLALIDGEQDPWRPACPHSDYAVDRNDTTSRPFKVIPGGVHHWDENGLADPSKEPADVQKIHAEEVAFVKEWLKEWQAAN
ncbi:serine carboxypeptidase S28-domain-containing protein [Hysterangium stoloniferum]|nr:serine carboxypeptidase S28-domain-containing protein [Hysterangium stoloniferum]